MYQVTRFLTFSAILFCSLCIVLAARPRPNRCDALVNCSSQPDFAWATDGGNCAVFQNDCQLQSHNCQRLKNNQKALQRVPRETCIKYCPQFCTEIFQPICTIHNGKSETMANDCFWTQKLCTTGAAYVFQFKGACAA